MGNKPSGLRRGCLIFVLSSLALLLLGGGLLAVISQRPELGAQGADRLRALIGDQPVADLEMALFSVEDGLRRLEYHLRLAAPAAPWQSKNADLLPGSPAVATFSSQATVTPVPVVQTGGLSATPTPTAINEPAQDLANAASPSATPPLAPWQPADLSPLGSLPGEGAWSAYIHEQDGRTVAYRTYLQPDPERPFAVVAIVAFDLEYTRLHYVLGYEEPFSPTGPKRSGAMPESDQVPGLLLAMFNGGFKATHGHFGAMADGLVALPPRDGIGTLSIYSDGRVKIGNWGSEINPSPDLLAWRQNGPLVVQDGQINPRIYDNSPKDWGYTVKDVSPTLRSGIGISADGQTLYYFAGPGLSMEALARSMLAAGVSHALQLDINNYWVHFVAVRDQAGELLLEPLLPDQMKENIDRYLFPHGRDFFYVMAKP